MLQSDFKESARYITARNVTLNVAAVTATWDAATGHLHVTYHLDGPPTDDDEEERELTVAELVAEFPAIRTASSEFGSVEDLRAGVRDDLVFERI
jgi:hypothetical protein